MSATWPQLLAGCYGDGWGRRHRKKKKKKKKGIVGPISFGWALHLGGTDVEGVFLVCFGSIRLLPL
ncbi:unnamed protein product [Prunus armeniaca]